LPKKKEVDRDGLRAVRLQELGRYEFRLILGYHHLSPYLSLKSP
jgi:hypothetical protein